MKSFRFLGIEVCYIPVKKAITTKETKPLKGNYTKLLATLSAMLTVLITECSIYAYDDSIQSGLNKINEAEALVNDYAFALGRLACGVMAAFEIVMAIKDGKSQAFWGIIVKYGIALGSLRMLPWVFDIISSFFS